MADRLPQNVPEHAFADGARVCHLNRARLGTVVAKHPGPYYHIAWDNGPHLVENGDDLRPATPEDELMGRANRPGPPTFVPGAPTTTDAYTITSSAGNRKRSWPALAPAPASDVQRLALRWFRDGDWSAVRPLLDELDAQNRPDDAKAIRRELAAGAFYQTFDTTLHSAIAVESGTRIL